MANLKLLDKLRGKTCWQAAYDVNIALALQFGKPVLKIGKVRDTHLHFADHKIKVK